METRAKNRPDRSKIRIPVGGRRDILTVADKDPNYKYTFVDDERVDRFQRGGYDLVYKAADGTAVGDRDIDKSKGTSSVVTVPGGQGKTLYLMRIPMEWYEEDMAAKHKRINESEEDIRRTLNSGQNGTYGKVEIG